MDSGIKRKPYTADTCKILMYCEMFSLRGTQPVEPGSGTFVSSNMVPALYNIVRFKPHKRELSG